jgi:hypothetical protein
MALISMGEWIDLHGDAALQGSGAAAARPVRFIRRFGVAAEPARAAAPANARSRQCVPTGARLSSLLRRLVLSRRLRRA